MKNKKNNSDALKAISKDRQRTNLLRKGEQKLIAYLVQRIPSWMGSDGLTAIGFMGNVLVASSFVIALYFGRNWLLISLLGFVINWFGDSLDGRVAYYRNKPRKWYGFSLDITIDWIGTFLIGLGFSIYSQDWGEIFGFLFVAMYGWEMLTALLRYKIAGKYSIDSGIFGPTEVRILIALIILSEVIFPGLMKYLVGIACVILLISNLIETRHVMDMGDERDAEERKLKEDAARNVQK